MTATLAALNAMMEKVLAFRPSSKKIKTKKAKKKPAMKRRKA